MIYPTLPMACNTPQEKKEANSVMHQLDPEKDWQCQFFEFDRSQTAAQRRLIGHWNRQCAVHYKQSWDWVHGESKMQILLPLMMGWGGKHLARADHIYDILHHLPKYKHKVSVSHGNIRSRKSHLNCRQVCEYLDQFARHHSDNGVVLTTRQDMINEAYGVA